MAVTEAAEAHAKASPGGRLPVPMVVVLDEAANVCRWADLPNLYSHYGSRGIPVWTFLQSWSQGVGVWGTEGMRALWSAANVKVYGGGVAETAFLDELAKMTGSYRPTQTSATHSRHGRTTTTSTSQETVLDVADLAALPRGRALLFPSGAPATLIRTEPWWTGPHAAAVRDSLDHHAPTSQAAR